MAKLWKFDGPEQQKLEDLLRRKIVTPSSKPSEVHGRYQEFSAFRPATFRAHWNLTKKKFPCLDEYRDQDETSNLSIPEVDGLNIPGPSVIRPPVPGPSVSGVSVQQGQKRKFDEDLTTYGHEKEPILKYRFLDPEIKQEFLMVIVMLYSGSKNLSFDIQETGEEQSFIINYGWPDLIHSVDELFKIPGQPELSKLHPQYIGAEAALRKFREHIDEKPYGKLIIPLPCKVSTDSNLWVNTVNKKEDGTTAVLFKFPVMETQFNSKKLNKMLVIS